MRNERMTSHDKCWSPCRGREPATGTLFVNAFDNEWAISVEYECQFETDLADCLDTEEGISAGIHIAHVGIETIYSLRTAQHTIGRSLRGFRWFDQVEGEVIYF